MVQTRSSTRLINTFNHCLDEAERLRQERVIGLDGLVCHIDRTAASGSAAGEAVRERSPRRSLRFASGVLLAPEQTGADAPAGAYIQRYLGHLLKK